MRTGGGREKIHKSKTPRIVKSELILTELKNHMIVAQRRFLTRHDQPSGHAKMNEQNIFFSIMLSADFNQQIFAPPRQAKNSASREFLREAARQRKAQITPPRDDAINAPSFN